MHRGFHFCKHHGRFAAQPNASWEIMSNEARKASSRHAVCVIVMQQQLARTYAHVKRVEHPTRCKEESPQINSLVSTLQQGPSQAFSSWWSHSSSGS